MTKRVKTAQSYELEWQFVSRLAAEHLGRDKYSTSTKALGELVSNSFDADATQVSIDLKFNDLDGFESVVISDNGNGISPDQLRNRFVLVGVEPNISQKQITKFGRFGVGRLAVYRIGSSSKWITTSDTSTGKRIRLSFILSTERQKKFAVTEEEVPNTTLLGTVIEIYNLRDSGQEALTPSKISNDLMAQFCSYLLGNPKQKILVQGESLNVNILIEHSETEEIPPSEKVPDSASVNHLLLTTPVDRSRFPGQVLFSAKGRTVASEQPSDLPSPRYLGLVECPYLNSIVTSNREALINMDGGFAQLRDAAIERVQAFSERFRIERTRHFIERARQEEYYPYRDAPSDAVTHVHQAFYDVVLEKVHEYVNLENMSNKQKAVVFRLLQRSLVNENLVDILHEVARLSDEDMEKFKKVLEHTTLDSIIRLSSEVTDRLNFLDILHELVYGDISKHLKERSQLHRILEPHCWIFGPRFYLATSDMSFREIIRKHRRIAGLKDVKDEVINEIPGVSNIPDLFLAASREYPIDPKDHHMLIELKSPSVSLGRKEVEQIRRYAQVIFDSSQFDKLSTRWDIFLVSAKAKDEIDLDRKQKDRSSGVLAQWENLTLWAFEWSELIARAKKEMQLVRDHLKRKSTELKVSDYLKENFPTILENLEKRTA